MVDRGSASLGTGWAACEAVALTAQAYANRVYSTMCHCLAWFAAAAVSDWIRVPVVPSASSVHLSRVSARDKATKAINTRSILTESHDKWPLAAVGADDPPTLA